MSVTPYRVSPQTGPVNAVVSVPGSKSVTNRALILAALAQGVTTLKNPIASDDSKWMVLSLRALGFKIEERGDDLIVEGCGGLVPTSQDGGRPNLFVGNAGTAARFLPCLVALAKTGEFGFDGDERMRERPMEELLTALVAQGAKILPKIDEKTKTLIANDRYPFNIRPNGLAGGDVTIDVTQSTQFASGLLMAAPYAKAPLIVKVTGDRQQLPYVDMTAAMLRSFGGQVERHGDVFAVLPGSLSSPGTYAIEPDLSGAAYFFAATALVGGKVTVRGTTNASIQGDIRFFKTLQHLGALFYQDEEGLTLEMPQGKPLQGGVAIDMNAFSDQALTLAALAPFCDGPITIKNIAHSRKQECDRIRAISVNLRALGVDVVEFEDGVTITPNAATPPHAARIQTFGDHRVAMAFSLIGLKVPGVEIDDKECVNKTFSGYWATLEDFQKQTLDAH